MTGVCRRWLRRYRYRPLLYLCPQPHPRIWVQRQVGRVLPLGKSVEPRGLYGALWSSKKTYWISKSPSSLSSPPTVLFHALATSPPTNITQPLPSHRTDLTPATRTGIWLRDSVGRMFNTCRIPGVRGCDSLSAQPQAQPSLSSNGNGAGNTNTGKILVMIHDWCYAIECYHHFSPRSIPPSMISPALLEERLRLVSLDAATRLAGGEKAVPIGVLSSDGRDRWGEVRCFYYSIYYFVVDRRL
jgi:hypothetical protein